jgi:hypothetical protein
MKKSIDQQLKEGLEKAQEVGDCLEWQGSMDHGKTPVVKTREFRNGRDVVLNITVGKLIWTKKNGPLKPGQIVYRKCCNNACVCEAHLAAGTHADKMSARKKAGATKHSTASVIKQTIAARAREQTKYSIDKAREVRSLLSEGLSQKEVSEQTGVSLDMVRQIGNGRSWRDTANPFSGLGAR